MHVSRPSLTESAARHAAAASVRRATHTALQAIQLSFRTCRTCRGRCDHKQRHLQS